MLQAVSSGAAPSARVTPVVLHGNLAFVSGQLPRSGGVIQSRGKVGDAVDLATARAAAELCAAACLDVLAGAVGEGNIVRVLKITGFVASAPGFTAQGAVIDGASDMLLARLGPEVGAHARSAIGVAELPHGASVEVEMIAAVRRPVEAGTRPT